MIKKCECIETPVNLPLEIPTEYKGYSNVTSEQVNKIKDALNQLKDLTNAS